MDSALLRRFVGDRLKAGLNATTVGLCVRLISTMFSDFAEEPRKTGVSINPVRLLPRSVRRLYRPTHDWKKTPYLKPLGEAVRVYRALREASHEQTAVAFAVGAFAMLRTGEVLGLNWSDVDLQRGEITVQRQVHRSMLGPLKDDESRIVPIQVALAPVLGEWRQRSGGEGFLFGPDRPGRIASARTGARSTFMRPSTLYVHLRQALDACHLPQITWYQATRHTGASHWVRNGGSLEKLALVMGHSSTEVTRRYAHRAPDAFGPREARLLEADLSSTPAEVVSLSIGQSLASQRENGPPEVEEFVNQNSSLRP